MIMALLVIGGVELNPGLPEGQEKTDQISTYVRNQEKECKVIKSLLEPHNQETTKIKKKTNALGSKIEKLSEVINEVIRDYKEIKQSVREWEEKHQKID
jgi:uncharacterized protein YoxC